MGEVVRGRQPARRADGLVTLQEYRYRVERVIDRHALVHAQARLEEIEERHALTVWLRVDERRVGRNGRRRDGARRAEGASEIRTLEIAGDALDRPEEESLVALDRPANRAAELLAMKVLEFRAVGQVAGEPFQSLEVEERSGDVVAARFGDHVHDTARRAAEFGRRAAGDHLKLFHRVHRDVDRRTLASSLLAEEPVVVVAAVEADVVEDAALPGEGNLVAVGPLHDADTGRQRQQVLELPSENGRRLDRLLIQRRRNRGTRRLDDGRPADGDRFGDVPDREAQGEVEGLTDGEVDLVLLDARETRQPERRLVAAGRQLQECESPRRIGHLALRQIGLGVDDGDVHAGKHASGRVQDRSLNDAGRNLKLGLGRGRNGKAGSEQTDENSHH